MEDNKISASISEPFSDNVKKLEELFPSVVKDGEVDFDALKAELGEFTEVGKESYSLNWAGKIAAQKKTGEPLIGKTLKFDPSESKNPETTENIYIEGDNLEALKLLQNSYRGKVKLIYIDPPYNTGKDFIYNDSFSQKQIESDKAEGKVSETGERYQINVTSSAHYHANWLSMMYPRLRLAKNLLSDDGVIFISIDDHEVSNLRNICDEMFGENNFIASIIWERAYAPVNLKKHFSESHDYMLCYAKNVENAVCNGLPRSEEADNRYENKDNDPRGPWKSSDLSVGPAVKANIYEITTPSGRKVLPPDGYSWRLNRETFDKYVLDNRIWFGTDGNNVPSIKRFLSEVKQGITPMTIWKYTDVGHSQSASQDLKKLFDGKAYFEYPKSVPLIKRCLELYTSKDSIILDFFSGSATTAHAVMELNADDGGKRQFILVQLPEDVEFDEFKTICDIGKERIRRAGVIIEKDHLDVDTGFKVFKVADTNIRWIAAESGTPGVTLEDALTASSKDLRDFMSGSNDLDVVYEILIRQYGIPLTAKITNLQNIGKRTYSIADTIIACLEENVTDEIIDKIAAIEPIPQKIVFRDSAFNDDISLKENAMMRLDALMQKHVSGGKQPYSVEFL